MSTWTLGVRNRGKYRLRCLLWLMGGAGFALFAGAGAAAVTTISQGYSTKEKLPKGSIVSLENNTTDSVVATTTKNANSLIGVVIDDSSSLLSLSNGQEAQTQVATGGTIPVLVSNINGEIAQGDQITASPIKGVGMKATSNIKVVGIAQGDLSGSSETTYKDGKGADKKIRIGQIPVLINVSYFFKEPEKTLIPSSIQNVANSLAGKNVSPLPIIVSAAIFLITLIVVAAIVYSIIRSSIISVGRNPMAQSAVYRNVIQLSALVLGILAVAVVAIYMVLTRF